MRRVQKRDRNDRRRKGPPDEHGQPVHAGVALGQHLTCDLMLH